MLSKTAIKYIQSLSYKKFRAENELFVAEGPKIIDEFLKEGRFKVKELFASRDYLDQHEKTIRTLNLKTTLVDEEDLKKISSLSSPNKVIGVFHQLNDALPEFKENNVTVLLDGISDPGNLGTIIRIADWFGVNNIICSNDCVDVYNTKVIQSTMGSINRVNVHYADLVEIIKKNENIPVYAAVLNGSSIYQMDKPEKCFIILGNESNGITEKVLNNVSNRISIPKIGKAESLNAAVAAAIILSTFKNKIS